MKIKPTGLVEQMSGSLGNLTIQASKAGLIARSKPSAIGRVTPFRNERRALMARAVAAWRSLTSPQRNAWMIASPPTNAYTPRGRMTPRGGYEYFIGQFCLDAAMNPGVNILPPRGLPARDFESIAIAITADPLLFDIAFTPTPLTTDELIYIGLTFYASPFSKSSGRKNFFTFTLPIAQTSPIDIMPQFGDYTPIFQPGLCVGVTLALYTISARRLSRPTLTRCTIAP